VIFWRKLPLRLASDSKKICAHVQSFFELPIPIPIPIPIPSKFSEKRMTHSPIPIPSGLRGMTTAEICIYHLEDLKRCMFVSFMKNSKLYYYTDSRKFVKNSNLSKRSKTHSTPRFVKFQSHEDTVYFPVKSPDYWGVRKRVSSFQNWLDFWGRKRTNQFSILLDGSIQEQSYLQPIVFDHVLRPIVTCDPLFWSRDQRRSPS